MDKYIKQVLLEENTIILPKLGALTVTSIKTGEMMFLSYLNYDDGKLAKFVAEKENISEDDARAKIKTFVDEIKEKVDGGQVYNLGKLGHFFKKNDEVFFEDYAVYEDQEEETEDQIKIIEVEVPDKVAPISVETKEETTPEIVKPDEIIDLKPEEPVAKSLDDIINAPAQEILEKVEEIGAPSVQEPISAETIIPENKIEEEPKKPADEPIIEFLDVPATATPDPVATRTPLAEKVQVENSYIPKKNPLVSKEIKATIAQIKVPKEESKTETKVEVKPETKAKTVEAKPKKEKVVKPKKKRGAFFWILIVLLGLGFTGGILTFMFYDQVKKYIPFIDNTETKEQKRLNSDTIESLNNSAEELEAAESERINAESNTETPVEEEIPSEAIPVETNQKPEKVEAAPIASSSNGSYHVIVGAFSVQANAERFAQKQGGSASVIPQGSMYLVSLSSHATRAEANQAMDNLDKAWILKKD
jgi:hypothetical protein